MNYEKFFREGLLFSASDATKLDAIMRKACLGLGVAMGAGVATAVAKDVANSPARSRYGPIAVAAGFVVGVAAGTLACSSVKSKIIEHLNAFRDDEVDLAIAALTPTQRNELHEEAMAILRMAAPEQLSSDDRLMA